MKALRTSQRGQTLIIVALSLPVTVGMLGLVVDVGWYYFQKQVALSAADSAALAGATEVYQDSGSIVCNSGVAWCSAAPTACAASPRYPPQNSYDTACLYAKQNGFTATGKQNVTVQAGATSAPTAPNTSNAYYMTVRVTQSMPLTFLSALGLGEWASVAARASAGVNQASSGGGGCIYVLDPSKANAFSMSGGNVTTGCGIYVNSNNAAAAHMTGGNLTLNNSADLTIDGGLSQTGGTITGTVRKNTGAAVSNPFSGMTAPTPAGSCQADPNISGGNSNTIQPGTYCSITVSGGNGVYFTSGTYIITSGSLKINGGNFSSTVSDVLIYIPSSNAIGAIDITGGNMVWTGLSGGGADGFVFWAANSAAQTVTGGNYTINGVTYMPNSALSYTGGNGTTQTVVADTLTITGGNITQAASSTFLAGTATPGAFLVE
jgi:hypothetical protein